MDDRTQTGCLYFNTLMLAGFTGVWSLSLILNMREVIGPRRKDA
jgi:hypothetical protein